jgi:hypothetical protein
MDVSGGGVREQASGEHRKLGEMLQIRQVKTFHPFLNICQQNFGVSNNCFANIEALSLCLLLIILTPTSDVWSNNFIKPHVAP